jgi:hypothetical protein
MLFIKSGTFVTEVTEKMFTKTGILLYTFIYVRGI